MVHKVVSFLIAATYVVLLVLFIIGLWVDSDPEPTPLGTQILGWAMVLGIGYGVLKYYEWARRPDAQTPPSAPLTNSTASTSTVAERLQRVDRLYEEGVISSEERELKRREIMQEL